MNVKKLFEKKEQPEGEKKRRKIYPVFILFTVLILVGAGVCGLREVYKERQRFELYQQAFELYKNSAYDEAEKVLEEIPEYQGVSAMLRDIQYQKGLIAFEAGQYEEAKGLFQKVSDYQDSQDYIEEAVYLLAMDAYTAKDYDTAIRYFEEIPDYKDVKQYQEEITFSNLETYFQAGSYQEAENCIFRIQDYPGVEPYGIVVLEAQGKAAYENQEYERAIEMFKYASAYSDWLDTYNGMSKEEKAAYDIIAGETDFKQRLKNISQEKELAEREYQALLCVKELVKYYENEKAEVAEISKVEEIRFSKQVYANSAEVPIVMISYKETADKKKTQSYAVYNETEFYGICPSLKMEEIDKSDSSQLQAYLKITDLWENKETVKIDMARIKKAMGWE